MKHTPQEAVREMLASTDDPAYSVDHRGLLSGWNRAAERLLGHPRREVLGTLCHEVVRGRDVFGNPYCQPDCPLLVMARRSEPVRHFQMDVVGRDGTVHRVLCLAVILPQRGAERAFSVIHLLRPVDQPLPTRPLGGGPGRPGQASGNGTVRDAWSPGGETSLRLTDRELEVLGHLAHGSSTREVAAALHITTSTVRKHIQNLMRKLGVGSRLAAVMAALEKRIL